VCIWRYILQNYNYKLHFQNLSIYHILHISIGTLVVENLDVCTTCDLASICWVCCWYWYQNLGGAPPRPSMPFLDSDTCVEGGRVIYFCHGFFPCMMPSMDGWRDRWMDGWKSSWKMSTTSFTICNHFLTSKSYLDIHLTDPPWKSLENNKIWWIYG
jgi:hypothetical protein